MANRIQGYNKQRQKLQLEITDLSGGFSSLITDYDMDARFLKDVQNMEFVNGMWQKRKGFHQVSTLTNTSWRPKKTRGLFAFNQQGVTHVVGVFDDTLIAKNRFIGSGTRSLTYGPIPGSERVRFAEFRNNCYIACGVDKLRRYDGHSVHGVPSPAASLLAAYDNRLVAGGIKGDPLTLYYSEDGEGDVWPALNFITLKGGPNEKITAIIPFLGKLVIFTNRAIYALMGPLEDFLVTKEVDEIGAVSAEAVQVYGNRFYFVAENGHIYEYDGGSQPVRISDIIDPYIQSTFTGLAIKNVVTTAYKDSVWFTFDTPERITLVFYPAYRIWTKFVGIPAAFYIRNNDALFFSGSGLNDKFSLYRYGTQYSDNGVPIEAFIQTPRWSFDALENIKRFKTLYIRGAIQGGGSDGFDVELYVDGEKKAVVHASTEEVDMLPKWGQATWGSFQWANLQDEDVGQVYEKIYLSQHNVISGKTFSLVLRDSNPNHGFRFEALRLEYIQKGAR